HFLQVMSTGVRGEAPIRLLVMGNSLWRDEYEWPLARTRYTNLHLHSGGKANSLRGNGQLSLTTPSEEPPDRYLYDPEDPVPTRGGTTLGLAMGVFDQTKIEEREDVLLYTGDVRTANMEGTGPSARKL